MVRLLPYPAHHQDVVVRPEGHQEHEHQEGQDEVEPSLASEMDEDDPGQTEGAEIRDHDAEDEVYRRHEASHHSREQDGDQDRDYRDDP